MGHTEKTEAKYTPGPWHFTASDPEGLVYSEDADFPIVPHQPSGFTRPEQIHNARLIAAAPDMLEALKLGIVKFDTIDAKTPCDPQNPDEPPEWWSAWHEATKVFRAAIVKATK